MASRKKLRWGILSTARINRALIEPVRTSKKSVLAAVASRSKEKAAEYAKTWEIPGYYSSYDELIEDPDIDVIYNSLPNGLHAEWSIKAMRYGKHVLCEKPLTTSVSDMELVITTAKETGGVITEAFMYRHHPQTNMVKRMVDEGAIGDILSIQGTFSYTNSRIGDVRLDPQLGGGCLWDVGCYPISYARFITGTDPIEVYGRQVTGKTGIDVHFLGQLLYPGNVIAQFECSFISPHKTLMEITGTDGRIKIGVPFKPGIDEQIVIESDKEVKTIKVRGKQLYVGEVQDIENAIMQGTSPAISLAESRGNIATIEALYHSARSSILNNIQDS